MLLDWLGNVFVVLTMIGCAIMLSSIFGLLYQLRRHGVLRRDGMELERARLAHPLPADTALPHVVVQIPSFNEGAIIQRSIESAAALDWPKDKLHVQVCDDSTDGTTELARAAAQRAIAAGIDVAVLHRSDRSDFKAGALHSAMSKTPHDYFAILDVDYVPAPDFLRRCMAVLIADQTLAFVQARPDFLNAEENWLTRAQAIMLDFHYALEQAARSWARHVLPFSGTCGIWRRAAIDAGGGWRGDTLSEDWDLSYRAWLAGWRGTFLNSVTVSGELPTRLRVWISQQNRWATGIGQVTAKMVPALFRNRGLSRRERRGALFPLALWVAHFMFTATIFLVVAAILLKPAIALELGFGVYLFYATATCAIFAVMIGANRFVGRGKSFWQFLLDFLPIPFLSLYISWANFWSVPATLLGRKRVFVRTPKEGAAANPS